ncbi:hypothetical protein [Paraburkholderia sp. ZP32-5]|uniref:hypothetical protein n=1 Tax=Paraburkholderia sp. ZP32-5 TaxID=2883245 RepID=UPI001F2AFB27|nr:hypothetical protein [Paraburkholderia sp. ZP32-5]
MNAPDNSNPTNPKAPPSLLAGNAGSKPPSQPEGSRILADLEGRVVSPAAPSGGSARRGAIAGVVALFVLAAGAVGVWSMHGRSSSAPAAIATATTSARITQAAASGAVVAANVPASAPAIASAPQVATIVADDSNAANATHAADSAPASDGVAAPASRLSRALENGATAADGKPAAADVPHEHQANAVASVTHRQHESKAEEKRKALAERHAEHSGSATSVAQAKKAHAERHEANTDDQDADLLAVLVARTKPAGRTPVKNAKPAEKKVDVASASLAQQIKACGEQNFFQGQLCRWRVCDGHWGKDPACAQPAHNGG